MIHKQYILILSLISLSLFAADAPIEHALDPRATESVQRALEQMKTLNVNELLAKANSSLTESARRTIAREEDESRILFNAGTFTAFYKRDIVPAVLLGMGYYSDRVLEQQYYQVRVEHVVNHMCTHYDDILDMLDGTFKAGLVFQAVIQQVRITAEVIMHYAHKKLALQQYLKTYLVKEHALRSSQLLDKKLLLPIVANYAIDSVGDVYTRPSTPYRTNQYTQLKLQRMFEPGGLQKAVSEKMRPFSLVTLAKYYLRPQKWFEEYGIPTSYIWLARLVNTIHGGVLPDTIFSGSYTWLYKFMSVGYTVALQDAYASEVWADFVDSNRAELYELLREYKLAVATDPDQVPEAIVERLRAFVIKGQGVHTGLIPKLFGSLNPKKNTAYERVLNWVAFPILAFSGYKLLKNGYIFGKQMKLF